MTVNTKTGFQTRFCGRQKGFTLLEVMISIVILTIGLVSLLGVFSMAMAATQVAQQDLIAKQLAQEAMEGLVTARQTADLTWDQINNTGGGGLFVAGLQPINQAGPDGIIGTADDAPAATLTLPGPSGIVVGSSPPDIIMPLGNFQRSIAIAPTASGDLRSVTITIQYTTAQSPIPRTYVLSTMISQYR